MIYSQANNFMDGSHKLLFVKYTNRSNDGETIRSKGLLPFNQRTLIKYLPFILELVYDV